jgi:hypothetical protein
MLHHQILSKNATDPEGTTTADHRIIDSGIGWVCGGKG